jgi:hypothetical protein
MAPTGASAASSDDHTYAQPTPRSQSPAPAAAEHELVRHVLPLPVDDVLNDVPSVAVELSASEFLAQPLVDTVANAQAAATPVIHVDGRNFCTVCNSFTCDHACELDFEWTADDDAVLIAGDVEDSDGYTSVPSSDEDALLAD